MSVRGRFNRLPFLEDISQISMLTKGRSKRHIAKLVLEDFKDKAGCFPEIVTSHMNNVAVTSYRKLLENTI